MSDFVNITNQCCMSMMGKTEDQYFDLAVVDPPYGINICKNKSGMGRRAGDAKAKYKIGDWDSEPPCDTYFNELKRVSKNQIIFGANHFMDRIWASSPCWIVWDKMFSNDVSFAAVELAWTSFSSTSKKVTCSTVKNGRIHPTQKPVELYEWILETYSRPGQKILDTHLGSGSIAVACHYFGAYLTASEIDFDYFAAAKKRIQKDTEQLGLFVDRNINNCMAPGALL